MARADRKSSRANRCGDVHFQDVGFEIAAATQKGKDLLIFLSQKDSARQLVAASNGYDLPSFKSYYDFDTWKTVEPPVGTVYGYPPRGDEQTSMFGAPARSEVGAQMYNQAIDTVMVSKFTQGKEKLDDVIKLAEKELEGTLRA